MSKMLDVHGCKHGIFQIVGVCVLLFSLETDELGKLPLDFFAFSHQKPHSIAAFNVLVIRLCSQELAGLVN